MDKLIDSFLSFKKYHKATATSIIAVPSRSDLSKGRTASFGIGTESLINKNDCGGTE